MNRSKPRGRALAQWAGTAGAALPACQLPVGRSGPGPTPRCPKIYAGYAREPLHATARCPVAIHTGRRRTGGAHGFWTHAAVTGDGSGERCWNGARGSSGRGNGRVDWPVRGPARGGGRDRRPRGLAGAASVARSCRVPFPRLFRLTQARSDRSAGLFFKFSPLNTS